MGKTITPDLVQTVKEAVSFSTVFDAANTDGGRHIDYPTGKLQYFLKCLFHSEKTASLRIDEEKGLYHCFGCGRSGDVITLVQDLSLANGFPDAVRYLAKLGGLEIQALGSPSKPPKVSLDIDYHPEFNLDCNDRDLMLGILAYAQTYYVNQLASNSSRGANLAREYLASRKITKDLVREVGIGYAPGNDVLVLEVLDKFGNTPEIYHLLRRVGLLTNGNRRMFSNRVTLPIATRSGKTLGFNARKTTDRVKSQKYINSPNLELFSKGHLFYGLEHLKDKDLSQVGLVLVEGQTDNFGFMQQGLYCSATIGSTTLTRHQVGLISSLNPAGVYLITDGDKAGIRGAIKNANRLLGTQGVSLPRIFIVPMPDKLDPFDLFYTKSEDARRCLESRRLTPKEFLLAQDEENLISDGMFADRLTFLRSNTRHIASVEELAAKGFSDLKEQTDSRFDTTTPHPFLLGK